MSIKFKLAIPIVAGMLLIILILQFFWLPLQLEKAKAEFKTHIQELLVSGETGIIQNLLESNLAALYSVLDHMQEAYEGRWLHIALFNDNNKQIYPISKQPGDMQETNANLIPVTYPLEVEGTKLGYLTFFAHWGHEKANVEKNVIGIRNMIAAMIFLILVITTVSQYGMIYKPLEKLDLAINEIKNGNLDTELPNVSNDEIGDLTKSFGDMLTELEFQKKALDAHAIVCMTDNTGRITHANKRLMDISGYSSEELIGQTFTIFKSNGLSHRLKAGMWDAITQGRVWHGEIRIQSKSGEHYWLNATIVPLVAAGGGVERFISILTDITKQKKAEERLRYMANHDALTGLASIRLGKEYLIKSLATARRDNNKAAVLFVDLDGFKQINDQLGHDAGDFVLVSVAKRFSSGLRQADEIVRIGGDEFLVILSSISQRDDAAIVAQKIIDILSEPLQVQGKTVHIGASVGIALYPDHSEEPETLIKRADEIMYAIKRNSKNSYGFYDEIANHV